MLTKMMSGSLGLEEPWYIAGVEFSEEGFEMYIYVDVCRTG